MTSQALLNDHLAPALDALKRGDPGSALKILADAEAALGPKIDIKLNLALAHRMMGNLVQALGALDAALQLDPYQFMALLSKGAILERMGKTHEAARTYKNALKLAPPDDQTPPALVAPIAHAKVVVTADSDALGAYLSTRLATKRAQYDPEALERFDQCLDVFAGRKRVYVQEPLLMHFPGLPATQFYDRKLFPWLAELEAATDIIRDELVALRAKNLSSFAPYIAFPPGAPVNQWGELNHSNDWSSFWLWKDGQKQAAACALCPKTAEVLERMPIADQPGFAPTAVFSSLKARTHIPAHTGSTNARLLVHLPLVLPGPARFRVGNDERAWKMGQAWVFDDTIEHEAWNDADETRTILIFDIWNPHLTLAERDMVSAMMVAKTQYQAL
jgi:aspartate beta-hydroxylase